MDQIIVQIYEIQTPFEAETMIELGVDNIGSTVVSQDEWKVASIKETIKLISETDGRSSLIPLYSHPDTVFRTLDYYEPNILHLCESLTDERGILKTCKDLIHLQEGIRERFPEVRITRTIPIAQTGMADRVPSIELGQMFDPVSDYFLTDTLLVNSEQPEASFVGITGQTCDWDTAKELVESSHIPVILAGGISPDNVSDGIRHVRPAGVDSCTGTNALDPEGKPIRFKKDAEKVKCLVEAVRCLIFDV